MHQDYSKMEFPVNVLRVVTIAVFGTLIYNEWYHAALFAVWTTSLYSSRWCIALHGQSIAEHYRVNRSAEKEDDDKPTNSTYHMAENLLGFNTGYHDEHHTFPKVSWYYLPALKKKFPEEFVNTNNLRYTTLWMEWAMTGFDTGHFRVCHK
jgi:sphingolipid delta-4 desaturase